MNKMETIEPIKQQELLLKKMEEHRRKKIRISIIYSLIPILVGVILILFTVNKLTDSQRELARINKQLELKQKEIELAKKKQKLLDKRFSQSAMKFKKIVATMHEIENFIEKKESFLRSLDEARFLINIRILFDKINLQFSEISDLLPGMPRLSRDRIWVTIVKSSRSLEGLKKEAHTWEQQYSKDAVAIYLFSNKFYGLALKGDGTFTTAYKLTVKLQKNGVSGAYFVATKKGDQNLLE